MEKTKNAIEAIKFRPLIYIGEKNINSLYTFFRGYTMGLHSCGFGSENDILTDFEDWLYIRFKKPGFSNNWCNLLLQEKANNQELAFNYFFELFDEFLSENLSGNGPLPG